MFNTAQGLHIVHQLSKDDIIAQFSIQLHLVPHILIPHDAIRPRETQRRRPSNLIQQITLHNPKELRERGSFLDVDAELGSCNLELEVCRSLPGSEESIDECILFGSRGRWIEHALDGCTSQRSVGDAPTGTKAIIGIVVVVVIGVHGLLRVGIDGGRTVGDELREVRAPELLTTDFSNFDIVGGYGVARVAGVNGEMCRGVWGRHADMALTNRTDEIIAARIRARGFVRGDLDWGWRRRWRDHAWDSPEVFKPLFGSLWSTNDEGTEIID